MAGAGVLFACRSPASGSGAEGAERDSDTNDYHDVVVVATGVSAAAEMVYASRTADFERRSQAVRGPR